jgi:thiamine-monophosphate kinase
MRAMRENDLHQHIFSRNTSLPERVTLGPGDDMGGVRIDGGQVLVTVDQLADGVHVDLRHTPLEKVGRKAITRNLSDVAAMAAVPVAAVVAVSLPRDFGEARANTLFDVMRDTASHYDCPLIGGDISMWDHPLLIAVTILARPPASGRCLGRQGARVGDVICVTGWLGGSLHALEGRVHHLDFEPRLRTAWALAEADPPPTAMIDLSDGLASDLARLCGASGVGAELWADRLPISPAARAASEHDGRAPWVHAVADGEDYELCFALPTAGAGPSLPGEIEGVPITAVGQVTAAGNGPRLTLRRPDGQVEALSESGWEHRGS